MLHHQAHQEADIVELHLKETIQILVKFTIMVLLDLHMPTSYRSGLLDEAVPLDFHPFPFYTSLLPYIWIKEQANSKTVLALLERTCIGNRPAVLLMNRSSFLASVSSSSSQRSMAVLSKGAGVVYTVCLSSCCPFAHRFYLLDGIIVSWDIVTYKWYRRSWLICRDKLIQVDGLIFEFPNENLALQSNLYPP